MSNERPWDILSTADKEIYDLIQSEITKWARVIKEADIKPE